MGQSSDWVSLGEAAQIIGVHPATIRNWAEHGELPFRRTPGGHRRFRRADLEQWLASHRVMQPTEAQVIVQSALGRARLEIGDRQKLAHLGWYEQLNEEVRDAMRAQGLRLMDTLITHLANPTDTQALTAAREIGHTYGQLLKGQGLALSKALEGYYYFADFLQEAVFQLAETGGRPQGNWSDMLYQVNQFTRQILMGMIVVYEEP